MLVLDFLILIILGVVLAVSANWVVQATSFFAKRFQIKSFIVGFLLLGAATNTPEIFVAIQSVRTNIPQMSVGNLLGGSILLLSFFMGASAMILGKVVLDHGMTKKRHCYFGAYHFCPCGCRLGWESDASRRNSSGPHLCSSRTIYQ